MLLLASMDSSKVENDITLKKNQGPEHRFKLKTGIQNPISLESIKLWYECEKDRRLGEEP